MGDLISDTLYDIESYPNFFCVTLIHVGSDHPFVFEISARRNDARSLTDYVLGLSRMIGFNNEHYDWPMVDRLITGVLNGEFDHIPGDRIAKTMNDFNNAIFASFNPWEYTIWPNNQRVPQIDLFKIHHFDNTARSTSLKALEFAMRAETIEDLPFPPGTVLEPWQMDVVIRYNIHDVRETGRFHGHSLGAIRFREAIGPHALNFNDTKIGKKFFAEELEKRCPGITKNTDGSKKQTIRARTDVRDLILPYVKFERPEFRDVLDRFRAITVQGERVKGIYNGIVADVDGIAYNFGAGGLHGSAHKRSFIADAHKEIRDVDVTSYYPKLAIVNRISPAHLGDVFCDVYSDLFDRRALHPKGTDENAILKLALNGVFGDTGSPHSVFRDIAYLLKICINGQLLLCMLAEQLLKISGLEIIQANTDGLTLYYPRAMRSAVEQVCTWWQWYTALTLEFADYSRMWVRDVNAYLAERTDGKLKRKGAYDYKPEWHKNHSSLVIARAAEAALVYDHDPDDFIRNHDDPWDFLLCVRVPKSSRLMYGDEQVQNTSRYYLSTDGRPLVKIMPPLPKTPDKWRKIGIHAEGLAEPQGARKNYHCSICGPSVIFPTKKSFEEHNAAEHSRRVRLCNTFRGDLPGIDLDYYRSEAEKLLF
jgi:hypothetical protein